MTKEPWEETFDSDVALRSHTHDDAELHNTEIKAFIRHQRQLARIETLREAKDIVCRLRKPEYMDAGYVTHYFPENEKYNDALNAAVVALSEAEKELND